MKKIKCLFFFYLILLNVTVNRAENCVNQYIEIPSGVITVLDLPIQKDCEFDFSHIGLKKNMTDSFIVYIQVDKSGKVVVTKVLYCMYECLIEPVLKAIRKMQFQPYIEEGISKPAQFLRIFHFPENNSNPNSLKNDLVFSNLRLPNIINRSNPVFPMKAENKGLKGIVEVDVIHDIYGRVAALKVVKGDYEMFNHQAELTIKKWIHEPLIVSGIPLKMRYKAIISFNSCDDVQVKLLFRLNYDEAYNSIKSLLNTAHVQIF